MYMKEIIILVQSNTITFNIKVMRGKYSISPVLSFHNKWITNVRILFNFVLICREIWTNV